MRAIVAWLIRSDYGAPSGRFVHDLRPAQGLRDGAQVLHGHSTVAHVGLWLEYLVAAEDGL